MYIAPVHIYWNVFCYKTKKNKQLLSKNQIQIKLFASYSVKKL